MRRPEAVTGDDVAFPLSVRARSALGVLLLACLLGLSSATRSAEPPRPAPGESADTTPLRTVGVSRRQMSLDDKTGRRPEPP
jgi:hypothetical protein